MCAHRRRAHVPMIKSTAVERESQVVYVTTFYSTHAYKLFASVPFDSNQCMWDSLFSVLFFIWRKLLGCSVLLLFKSALRLHRVRVSVCVCLWQKARKHRTTTQYSESIYVNSDHKLHSDWSDSNRPIFGNSQRLAFVCLCPRTRVCVSVFR